MTDLAPLLAQSFAQQQRGVHTAMPGVIQSYDAGAQRASVKPALSRNLSDGEVEELPILEDVPVIWPRSGGASMTFPIKSGDGCLLIFMERSIDEFKGKGGDVTPADPRQHALSDAVALMGFVHFGGGGGPDDAVEIKMGDTTVTVKDGEAIIKAPSVTIDAPETTVQGNMTVQGSISGQGGMSVQGSLAVDGGALTHNGTNVGDDHVHGGVEPGSAKTDGPE